MKKYTLGDWFFLVLLVALSFAFYRLISYFIIDVFLAFILTNLFKGIHNFLKLKFSNKISALISIILVLFGIIIPVIVVGLLLSNEAANTIITIKHNWPKIQGLFNQDTFSNLQSKIPLIKNYSFSLDQLELQKHLTTVVSTSTEFIMNLFRHAFVNISVMLFHLIIVLFLLYFFLVEGKNILAKIQYLIPLRDDDAKELFTDMTRVTEATLLGTIIIGLIEGIYGAIIFFIFGIPSALFWGVIMMVVSMIPIVGINSILVPAGIILIVMGNWISGITIILLSYGGTTITQNYLKPNLVGIRGGLHPAIVLISTLGGLSWMGLIGFIIGPVIAALFISIWNQFGRRFKTELLDLNN